MSVAQLKFIDNEDGTMAIDCTHDGAFDPVLQSHQCLRAVAQFLPQILAPAGTLVQGDVGIRSPISDADRYQALRALALMSEVQREAIRKAIAGNGNPGSEIGFDRLADSVVMLARGAEVHLASASDSASI